MSFRSLIVAFVIVFMGVHSFANDGMWLPNLLKKLNEPEMKSLGMRISAEDIYSINNSSIKDAVVHFGGGCTGEVISQQGLLLTNHHCGYSFIQRHSSPENNYLEYGFWAENMEAEIPNPGLSVTFIVRIDDVTDQVLSGIQDDLSAEDRQSAIDQNLNTIKENANIEDYQNVFIRPFYEGNEYYMFTTVTYRDVRLVGTPPSFIGKYGADTDNWVWPRHTGDFALFRIYADENNLPADYSPENKPYEPKYSMTLSMDGVAEDDFVFAFGFPGRTDQYLHSSAIDQVQNVLNPHRVAIRDRALDIIDGAMRADSVIKIQYASKQSRISNYWKKWRGESLGLQRSEAVRDRKKYEREFNRRINLNPEFYKYKELTSSFARLYSQHNPYAQAAEIYQETILRNPEINAFINAIHNMMPIYEDSGQEAFEERRGRLQGALSRFFKDYRIEIDTAVLASLLDYHYNNQEERFQSDLMLQYGNHNDSKWSKIVSMLYASTHFDSEENMAKLLNMPYEEMSEALSNDDLFTFITDLIETAKEKIYPEYNELTSNINALKRQYMEGQRAVFPERTFFPDANSTMRVSYGKVSGYNARDAVYFEPLTTIDGVMEKYKPGDYEFDLDEKFRKLVDDKDYGIYEVDGTVPVNFIAAIHTTGGNSGSPVLDADGALVGLLFDGAWEGVMSDIYYSEDLVRSIMVDIRYVLFIIDKYAGAQHIMDELKVTQNKVNPDGKKSAIK